MGGKRTRLDEPTDLCRTRGGIRGGSRPADEELWVELWGRIACGAHEPLRVADELTEAHGEQQLRTICGATRMVSVLG